LDNRGVLAVAPPLPRIALVPNAIAFRDPQHGLMGTGWQGCTNPQFGCKPQGTISITSSGGKSWTVLLRTPRPVVWVSVQGRHEQARFDDGETIGSSDRGLHWSPVVVGIPNASQCPANERSFVSGSWLLCTGVAGVGNQGKSLYRYTAHGIVRVAYTPFPGRRGGYGGISAYGYPQGVAMATDGFGVIWESRGTLYVTRDGGSQWTGLPTIARPDVDFGMSGFVLRGGIGWVLLARGGSKPRRLLETTDAGRSWHVVHTWD
jgi:photosystem II stability/assembly factor-like uncharacterized protein